VSPLSPDLEAAGESSRGDAGIASSPPPPPVAGDEAAGAAGAAGAAASAEAPGDEVVGFVVERSGPEPPGPEPPGELGAIVGVTATPTEIDGPVIAGDFPWIVLAR